MWALVMLAVYLRSAGPVVSGEEDLMDTPAVDVEMGSTALIEPFVDLGEMSFHLAREMTRFSVLRYHSVPRYEGE